MKRWSLAVVTVVALLGSGCMVSEEQLRLQREVLELTRRVDSMDRTLRSGQEETKNRIDTVARGQAELQAAVDGLRVDQQGMQGRFDDLSRADATLRQDLSLLKDDFGLQVADLGQRLAKLEQANAGTPAEESADALYERGLQTIRDGQDTATGREQMASFLKRYPNDPRAVNAAYWIGEAYYTEQAFDKAALQFEEVIQKYRDDPKVAAALYKQALAFEALGDRASARLVMKKLVGRFPMAEETKKAKDKLKEWGK